MSPGWCPTLHARITAGVLWRSWKLGRKKIVFKFNADFMTALGFWLLMWIFKVESKRIIHTWLNLESAALPWKNYVKNVIKHIYVFSACIFRTIDILTLLIYMNLNKLTWPISLIWVLWLTKSVLFVEQGGKQSSGFGRT